MFTYELMLPTGIVIGSFFVKLFVDQSPDMLTAVEALYALPVDVIFLAITFAAAFIIGTPGKADQGLSHFGCYSIVAIVSVVIMRRSRKLYDAKATLRSGLLCLANYAIAITTLVISMQLVSGA